MPLLLWQKLNYKQNLMQQTWTFHVESLHEEECFLILFFFKLNLLSSFLKLSSNFLSSFYFIAYIDDFFSSKKKFQETTQDSLVSKSSSCRSRFCRIARARYDIEPPFPPLSNMRKSFLDYKMNIKLPSNIWIKYFRKRSS